MATPFSLCRNFRFVLPQICYASGGGCSRSLTSILRPSRQSLLASKSCTFNARCCSANSSLSVDPNEFEDVEMEDEEAPEIIESFVTRQRRNKKRRSKVATPIQDVDHAFDPGILPSILPDTRRRISVDMGELRQLLFDINAMDVCCVKVPREKMLVDYFISFTGKSARHRQAMGVAIVGKFKQLYVEQGTTLLLLGNEDWYILDLGNILIHILSEDERERLEFEKLWTLGPEHDDQMKIFNRAYDTVYDGYF